MKSPFTPTTHLLSEKIRPANSRPWAPRRSSIAQGDDDVALLVSLLDVPMGFGDSLQRISSVDRRLELPRFCKLLEPDEIVASIVRQRIVHRDEFACGRQGALRRLFQRR